jgi:hypothetical protein
MASPESSQKLLSRLQMLVGPHVPSDTNADIASGLGYVDMRDADAFAVLVQPTTVAVNSNGVTRVEIVAAVDTNGTNAQQIKDSGALTVSNTSWYYATECLAEEIVEIGRAMSPPQALRYVAARITCDNGNSRASTTYVLGLAKRQYLNLTASRLS